MGKERDHLIRRLGGRPLADLDLSDAALMHAFYDSYRRARRLPPEIAPLRRTRAPTERAGDPDTTGRGF